MSVHSESGYGVMEFLDWLKAYFLIKDPTEKIIWRAVFKRFLKVFAAIALFEAFWHTLFYFVFKALFGSSH